MSNQNVKLPIISARLRIRRFARRDMESFAAFMADPESTRFLAFDDRQKNPRASGELLEATINSYDSDEPMLAFAVDDSKTNEFVGFCGLTPREADEVEIMYAIMPQARGKGYAAELAESLASHAIDELGYQRVVSPISTEHQASKAVAAKAGFEDCGISQDPGSGESVQLFVLTGGRR